MGHARRFIAWYTMDMGQNARVIVSIIVAIVFLGVIALLIRALLPENTVQIEVSKPQVVLNTNS